MTFSQILNSFLFNRNRRKYLTHPSKISHHAKGKGLSLAEGWGIPSHRSLKLQMLLYLIPPVRVRGKWLVKIMLPCLLPFEEEQDLRPKLAL